MAGFLELFTRYVDEIGSNPISDTASNVRSDRTRDAGEREAAARDIERIADVLGLRSRGGR
ncbi:MAG: hypothetical protein AAGA93_00610 [Actinomycetota bacterium]